MPNLALQRTPATALSRLPSPADSVTIQKRGGEYPLSGPGYDSWANYSTASMP